MLSIYTIKPNLARYAISLASCALCLCFGAGVSHAFCGLYVAQSNASLINDATTVVLARSGTRTTLTMQNTYRGPLQDFAMVVPVPVVLDKKDVRTLTHESIEKMQMATAPRLVEYWEQDPCRKPPRRRRFKSGRGLKGFGGGGTRYMTPSPNTTSVQIQAAFSAGEYDVKVLSASDSSGLLRWLRQNSYQVPPKAQKLLRIYIQQGMYFFVAKVNIQRAQSYGPSMRLSPLQFTYDSTSFSLPVRLGLVNANGPQDLRVYVLHKHRVEVDNRRNVMIPTNLAVMPAVKEKFGMFYTMLLYEIHRVNPGSVITEYAWGNSKCDPCTPAQMTSSDLSIFRGGEPISQGESWTVTRLHARLHPNRERSDLLFRAASPIHGGVMMFNRDRSLKIAAKKVGDLPRKSNETKQKSRRVDRTWQGRSNRFQGRYIIYHPWTEEISCGKSATRNMWGYPNGSAYDSWNTHIPDNEPEPEYRLDWAAAYLNSVLRTPVSSLGLYAEQPRKYIFFKDKARRRPANIVF